MDWPHKCIYMYVHVMVDRHVYTVHAVVDHEKANCANIDQRPRNYAGQFHDNTIMTFDAL